MKINYSGEMVGKLFPNASREDDLIFSNWLVIKCFAADVNKHNLCKFHRSFWSKCWKRSINSIQPDNDRRKRWFNQAEY